MIVLSLTLCVPDDGLVLALDVLRVDSGDVMVIEVHYLSGKQLDSKFMEHTL